MLCAALLPSSAIVANAQDVRRDYDIPVQPLSTAVTSFGRQSGVQISAPSELLAKRISGSARGRLSRTAALTRILIGTGLTYRVKGATIIILQMPKRAASPGR